MATTFIYPIKVTGELSLNYDTENKNAKIINTKNEDSKITHYVTVDKKGNVYNLSSAYLEKMKNYISYDNENIIFHTLKTGINCSTKNAYNEWEMVRDNSNNKRANCGNLQYCIIQNFGTDLDPAIANEIGTAFARKYLSDYQCVVSTHINTGLVHNHIEFNATSFVTGKKFNDDLNAIRDIRKISDELCYQYELDVLEKTKDFNFIIYKDANGKTKIYEPTERKNKILENQYSNKNDYRNTEQYKISSQSKENHITELKNDIDKLIVVVDSYEDLLQQLKNFGYEIKDKNKDGQWRKHISFKSPGWMKYVRDVSLGEEYEREFLTDLIRKNKNSDSINVQKEDIKEKDISLIDDIKKSDIYMYGRIIIDDIDEEYRYKKKKNEDEYEKIKRSNIEKIIIADTKKINKEIDTVVKSSKFQMLHQNHKIQELSNASKKEQYLINRINGNLKTLKFIESREIKSIQQINNTVKSLYQKRNVCYSQLNNIAAALKKANAGIVMIDKYNSLKETISMNRNNEEYVLNEMKNDIELIKDYEALLDQRGLLSIESQNEFKEKCSKYNSTFLELSKALERVNNELKAYDECIYNLKIVDKDYQNKYLTEIESYYNEKEKYNEELDER